jgi:hypothetical protein
MTNTKKQISSKSKAPNSKTQGFEFWNLYFVASLGFGAWNLGLGIYKQQFSA